MSFFVPPPGSGSGGLSAQPDVFVSNLQTGDTLVFQGTIMKWTNTPLTGGVDGAYTLGRVLFDNGWPSVRPADYQYIDWVKVDPTDPDPPGQIMAQGDTVS